MRQLDRAEQPDIATDRSQRAQILLHAIEVRRGCVKAQYRFITAQVGGILERQRQC
jgi:hypothetical protein